MRHNLKQPRGTLRIVIADDHEMIRTGMRSVLESRGDVDVWEAENGMEAVEKTREMKPDLVILDVSMPLLDGFSAASEIKKVAPDTRILIVSMDRTDTFVEVARKIGVSGYLIKTDGSKTLLEAVAALLRSETFFPSKA